MAALHAGELVSLCVADADMARPAILFLLGDVEIAALAAGDVVGTAHAAPLTKELTLRREDLDALVGTVGNVELAGIVIGDAVRQVELALAFTRRAPRGDKPAVAREAVHASVAVAVGHIDIAVGVGHHLGRVIERPGGALRQPVGPDLAGVGMLAPLARPHNRLAV